MPGESQGQRSLAGYCPWGRDSVTKLLLLYVEFRKQSKLTNIAKHRGIETENTQLPEGK